MHQGALIFEKYKILEVIGQGGTSEVYLVENIKLGNKWAIKKAYKGNDHLCLHAEPNILIKLDHPAIPKIIDIEEDQEAVYIIEEYIEGINLKNYKLQKGNIAESIIIDFARQVCKIMKYLHGLKPNPIIFRDLKPENIILTKDHQLKLVDFGIAREFKETSASDTMQIGTKGYAAPEQYGIGQSDGRTDIFSLGVTLYYLFTGNNLSVPPYRVGNIRDQAKDVSEKMEAIIYKCCEMLPDQRYQSIDELETALADIQDSRSDTEVLHIEKNSQKKDARIQKETINKIPKNKKQKTVIIGVIGVSSCVGTTHSSIMLANVIKKRSKIAVIERNGNADFAKIFGQHSENVLDKNKKNRFKKVDYYYGITFENFIANVRDQYEYVIVDFGSYEDIYDFDEFIHTDIRLVVGHGIDWKVEEVKRFYESTKVYDQNSNWIYGIPFMDKKHLGDIRGFMKNQVIAIPFTMNPFGIKADGKRIFEKII